MVESKMSRNAVGWELDYSQLIGIMEMDGFAIRVGIFDAIH